jgi:hypothetical protein
VTQQELTAYCQENARLYSSLAACTKQHAGVFRATADCTVGRITTTAELTYTLDGLWDKSDLGAGRTRWRDAEGTVVATDLANNGLHISQQWDTLCPGPVSAALIARAVQARQAAPVRARAVAPANPPICGDEPLCTEVNDFAVTIVDFRAGLNAARKVLTVSLRFENKTNRPLILGYVPASGAGIDDRGNRYVSYDADIRGIGLIARTVDSKFVLQPGQRSDARFTYFWDAGRTVYGTTFDVELTAREIVDLGNNQVQLGAEYPLRFTGLVDGARPGAPSGSSSNAAPAPAAPSSAPAAAPAAARVDNCAGNTRPCFDAGDFSVTVTGLAGTTVGGRHHTLRLNVEIRNHSPQQVILGYRSSASNGIDNLGNAYTWGRPSTVDTSVQGIGVVIPGRSADLQFRVAPNSARTAVFNVTRFNSGRQQLGTSWSVDTVLVEMRVLPNGTQSEVVREYSVHLPDLRLGGAAVGTSTNDAAEQIKKAGDAIRGILGGGRK